MALSNHKRDTLKRFDKLKILEHDLALSSEKNLKIKLVRPLRNLKNQKFDTKTKYLLPTTIILVDQLVERRRLPLMAKVGVSSNPTTVLFGRFFFHYWRKGVGAP